MSKTQQIQNLKEKLDRGEINRREFLFQLGILGVSGAFAAMITGGATEAEAFFNMNLVKKRSSSSAAGSGYSLRFDSSRSCNLTRTLTTATNNKIWTYSCWLKRGAISTSANHVLLTATTGSNFDVIYVGGSASARTDRLVYADANVGYTSSSALLRDVSAWYHIVVTMDTTQATASNRLKFYINGVLQTFNETTYHSQNYNTPINGVYPHSVGNLNYNSTGYLDGYLSDVYFIDGQALDATSFGQTDSTTGAWNPKTYSGTYGTNGFYLKFDDATFATAAAIGKDSSGNGNNWTPTGITVNDQTIDCPNNNFATLLQQASDSSMTFSNGNLQISCPDDNQFHHGISTIAIPTSGKWYVESACISQNVSASHNFGLWRVDVLNPSQRVNGSVSGAMYYYSGEVHYAGPPSNAIRQFSATQVQSSVTSATGDVIGIAFDVDGGTVAFYKNGTQLGTTVTNSYPANSTLSFGMMPNGTAWVNFGQGGQTGLTLDAASGGRFKHTPPSGFKALCTANIATPAVQNPSQFFNTIAYSGNSSTQSLTATFQSSFIWLKCRNVGRGHRLLDEVRGFNNVSGSEGTYAEYTGSAISSVSSSAINLANADNSNISGENYVAWYWKRGANPGFDVVNFAKAGTGAETRTHSLGVAPAMIIVKARSTTENWSVWNRSLASSTDSYLNLNSTSSVQSSSFYWGAAPSSSGFSLGGSFGVGNHIAYLWAEVPGFSRFATYTGNGSTDGPFVWCGFRPAWIMLKRIDGAEQWLIYDNRRGGFNPNNFVFGAQTAASEDTTAAGSNSNGLGDILSNGFKIRSNGGSNNSSGGTYIFAAFAEMPFKYARAR
jgi:hypothetical protein